MDGLGQAVGNGISSLVGGAVNAIGGIVDALGRALPGGALPIVGIGIVLLVVLLLLRR